MSELSSKSREDRARRELGKQGYRFKKSRTNGSVYRNGVYQGQNADDHGGYMILDASTDFVVVGERFDLTLEDVEKWVEDGR